MAVVAQIQHLVHTVQRSSETPREAACSVTRQHVLDKTRHLQHAHSNQSIRRGPPPLFMLSITARGI